MDWTAILIVLGVVATLLAFKQLGQVSKSKAVEYLRHGAKLIDVRSVAEFQSGHISNALNIPVGEIEEQIGLQVANKDQVLLLHCASGVRSAMGAKTLKRLGYVKVFNLGSYGRAESIVRESEK